MLPLRYIINCRRSTEYIQRYNQLQEDYAEIMKKRKGINTGEKMKIEKMSKIRSFANFGLRNYIPLEYHRI